VWSFPCAEHVAAAAAAASLGRAPQQLHAAEAHEHGLNGPGSVGHLGERRLELGLAGA